MDKKLNTFDKTSLAMQQSRFDYSLCKTMTVPVPKGSALSSEFDAVEVLYHPDAPFSFRELYDDILPSLGKRYQERVTYFLTPVPMRLEYIPLGSTYGAVLTFESAFHQVTLEHMKYLKKVIGSMAKKHSCEVVFRTPVSKAATPSV